MVGRFAATTGTGNGFLTTRQPGENLQSFLARAQLNTKIRTRSPSMQLFTQHAHHCHDLITGVLAHLAHVLGWLV
jgi:hypothetical protein